MIERTELSPWGHFALVTYVPDPLGSFFHDLRSTLPNEDHPQAHITILPPRPLLLPLETASKQVLATLERFSDFTVELANVRCFPMTNFLYLDVGEGNTSILELHDALNTGDLAHEELYDFRPHVTLAGPVPVADLSAVLSQASAAWAAFPSSPRFNFAEIVCLWSKPGDSAGTWHRIWCHRLTKAEPELARVAATGANFRTL